MEKISEQIEERDILEGLRAGLGQKKKTEMKMRMRMGNFAVSSAKAKTLAEKRSKLQEDILKFGVAAIEKLYPRQGRKSTNTRRTSDTRSAYRMKPVPHDMHFEEVEASKINPAVLPLKVHKATRVLLCGVHSQKGWPGAPLNPLQGVQDSHI